MKRGLKCIGVLALACLVTGGVAGLLAQESPKSMKKPTPPAGTTAAQPGPFLMHDVHVKQGFDCDSCHLPVKEGSVVLKRPGHDECGGCHKEDFAYKTGATPSGKYCTPCHDASKAGSSSDLLPYPRFKNQHAILVEFSHEHHADPKARIDPITRARADCAFCHQVKASGDEASFPGHVECASCHAKAGIQPMLSATSTGTDCHGCHNPEQMENPTLTKVRQRIAPHIDATDYLNIKFSHSDHFNARDRMPMVCATCHSDVTTSKSLAEVALPNKIDCVGCHETSKALTAEFRMTNCQLCHVDHQSGPIPASHTRDVKPASHTEGFRPHHSEQAAGADAKCFLCHTSISPKSAPTTQCLACHQVMRPASHTARWADDLHGKYAAIDRTSCATCHQNDFCSRCHNELPRTHVPLPPFKNGGHARLAMLNKRSCFTCHTYQDTCAECHLR